jgi:hypothetical protein
MDWQCRCTTVEHKHLDNRCPKPAVTADGYCQECHDKAAKEAMDAQEITRGDQLEKMPAKCLKAEARVSQNCLGQNYTFPKKLRRHLSYAQIPA